MEMIEYIKDLDTAIESKGEHCDAGCAEDIIPSVIYSNNVEFDSSRMFYEGGPVRTTLLIKLHYNCIFETRNTFYILLGKGVRKNVDVTIAVISV